MEGRGKAPWVVRSREREVSPQESKTDEDLLASVGGAVMELESESSELTDVLALLYSRGIQSVMVEGGAQIINNIMGKNPSFIDALIVTIAPTYLGAGGASISPPRSSDNKAALRCAAVSWVPLGSDIVLCCKVNASTGS